MGLVGQYSKMFDRSQFFRFVYKYGFGYPLLDYGCIEHTAAFVLRSGVLFSSLSTLVCLLSNVSVVFSLFCLFLFSFILALGLTMKHGFKPSLYIIQLGKCPGEYYRLYKIMRLKNRKGFGYGKESLKMRVGDKR